MNPEEADLLERLVNRNIELRAFLLRCVDPEDWGHALPADVRQEAAVLLRIRKPDGQREAP